MIPLKDIVGPDLSRHISKKEGKDLESIQSNTTPDSGHHISH